MNLQRLTLKVAEKLREIATRQGNTTLPVTLFDRSGWFCGVAITTPTALRTLHCHPPLGCLEAGPPNLLGP